MTAREKAMVAWIAKVVMGLTTDGIPGSGWYRNSAGTQVRFRPHLSISDAMDALEAWADDDQEYREYELRRHAQDSHSCALHDFKNITFACQGEAYDENLRRAICEALCAATGFEWKGEG